MKESICSKCFMNIGCPGAKECTQKDILKEKNAQPIKLLPALARTTPAVFIVKNAIKVSAA